MKVKSVARKTVKAKPLDFRKEIQQEVRRVPKEDLANLLKIVRAFRETVAWPTAEECFKQGWIDAIEERVYPISQLWEMVDAP